jgi:glycosyltransferase involved in cell wall biosynthesis
MKLLHIIASADPAGGGPIEGLIRQDEATRGQAERHIVTLDLPDAPFLRDFPIKVIALGSRRRGGWRRPLERYGYSPDLIPWLRAHVHDYDAVVVEGLWNYATFAAAMVLPGAGVPYFVFTHGMMDPWFRQQYPLKHLAKQGFWLIAEGRLLAGARSALFTTEDERQLARNQFWGHRYTEAVVGYGTAAPPPPTDAQRAAFAAAAPSLRGRPYLLYLSRIHPKKGCDLLIQAFADAAAAAPDLDLVIAGPGDPDLVADLKVLATTCGVSDRIHWPGLLLGDAKWGAFHGAQAFTLTSHQENFGVVVAEALACGAPVLISDKVNIWREIEAAESGLVAPDTREGATALLSKWLALGERQRDDMRNRAKALFHSRFDVCSIAPELLLLIRSGL